MWAGGSKILPTLDSLLVVVSTKRFPTWIVFLCRVPRDSLLHPQSLQYTHTCPQIMTDTSMLLDIVQFCDIQVCLFPIMLKDSQSHKKGLKISETLHIYATERLHIMRGFVCQYSGYWGYSWTSVCMIDSICDYLWITLSYLLENIFCVLGCMHQ